MRKSVFNAVMLLVLVVFGLAGCGGGGGGTTDTQTPTGTAVSLAQFRSVYIGTAATGTQFAFPTLSGTDSQGRAWSGSLTSVSDGATTFESQSVTKRRTLVTLGLVGGTAVSETTTAYFQASNGSPYKSITSTGVTYTSSSAFVIPSTAKVGDFGDLGTTTGSDGTTITASWTLAAGSNGTSTFAISSVSKTGSTTTAVEVDSFHLDASGIPTSISISVTINGVTVNLAGNKG